ncbi:hypothetical protein [Bacteroides gallinaceum]|uniref:Lipoprotein n=2 Tax=Bacteroidaceae TaxID=815 RepID=A0ABT7VHH8_9BACE|nr:hypothetical protein [Bacteroides gallinaceum]MBU3856422.1 hypothetical protein [Candidatus Phocaeicola excrementipullorum]MDM8325756.1 hypothetical protein [Bacteroides gallinaceum]
MKCKHLIFICTVAFAIISCGGNGSADSMFGKIPSMYEKTTTDMLQDLSDINKAIKEDKNKEKADNNLEKLKEAFQKMEDALKETEKKARPYADEMAGKTIPYEQTDSLQYTVISDITIKEVLLPKIRNLGSEGVKLEVTFDIKLKKDAKKSSFYIYFLMAGDKGNIGYDKQSIYCAGKKQGDVISVKTTINAPDVPTSYLNACERLIFVTEDTYYSQRSKIKKQQEQWEQTELEKYGLNETD